jgi:osmoprotectant transport system ATP-binding protein
MDEPFGALDPVLRQQLQEEFLGIKAHVSKTILLVTHDVGEAFRLGDRVGVVAGGRLIRVGTPEDLIMDPGSPEVALLIGVEQKMRYLDLLSIRPLMVPVDPSRVIEVSFSAGDARNAMIASRAEYLLVGPEGVPEGIIFPQDLLAAEGPDTPLGELLRKIPVFDSSAPASDVLSDMKEQGASTALVLERGRAIGLVIMDEIVRQLL